MNCQNCAEQMGAYIGDGLRPAERLRLVEHLAGCADCRRELIVAEKTRLVLAGPPAAAMPDALRARVGALIDAAPAPRTPPWGAPLRWTLGAAAAAVAVVVGFGVFSPRSGAVELSSLLAEHARGSRKSVDIRRAALAAAPFDYVEAEIARR